MKIPQDKLLAELILKHKHMIWKIHDHDSLLENQVDEHLTEEERKSAWEEYENEKKGIVRMANTTNLNMDFMMTNINPEMIRVIFGF
jgi:predicted DsbA family dithiol-disulfide isomerase